MNNNEKTIIAEIFDNYVEVFEIKPEEIEATRRHFMLSVAFVCFQIDHAISDPKDITGVKAALLTERIIEASKIEAAKYLNDGPKGIEKPEIINPFA